MYIRIIPALAALLMLAGCAGDVGDQSSRMTQEINTSSTLQSSSQISSKDESSSSSQISSSGDASQSGDRQDAALAYFSKKAEKDAVEIDIDRLDASYRVGGVSAEEFASQKQSLRALEEELDREEDRLEVQYNLSRTRSELPTGTLDQLLARMSELEAEERNIERDEDALVQDYLAGGVTRDEFIKKQTEIIMREEQNDELQDAVEHALERLGWDD